MNPKIIVFDLDYTLWPFWVDTHVTPPFSCNNNQQVVDKRGFVIKPFPEVTEVLEKLKKDGYILGVASRTSEIAGARQLIKLLNWEGIFTYVEIFPGCKVNHFHNIHKSSACKYEEMIFFDDEQRNILDIQKLGVTSILVKDGVSKKVIRDGLLAFSNKSKCT